MMKRWEDERGRASTMHGEKEICTKDFGAETSQKQATWKTQKREDNSKMNLK